MRFSIFAFDIVALLVLAVPSLVLLASAAPGLGPLATVYLGSILLGALCLVTDLALLSRQKADSETVLSLRIAGLMLIVTPAIAMYLQASHH
jgi:hypothetical protein